MDSIITHLILYIQYLHKIIYDLILFIYKNIPLGQMSFDDSNSPKYQKFKVYKLPKIIKFEKVDYQLLLAYYKHKYNKTIKAVQRRNGNTISTKVICPKCGAPHDYIYDNNGGNGQYKCKVCGLTFKEKNFATTPIVFKCPYCETTLTEKKQRKHFKVHKCTNPKCSYYLRNLKKLPKTLNDADKYKYKLHYIYREFNINFFKVNLYSVSKRATTLNFKKFNPHIMGLESTYHVNLKLSTRKTAHALKEVHGIDISHTMVSNYALIAAAVIKPFVDTFDKFKEFPGKALKFIADGYTAYPLAKQQFELEENKDFDLTQVIGLTNDDPVSAEYRWVKQIVERLNRTFKSSYRVTCGYGSDEGAVYSFALWVAYYNFLRPHPYSYLRPLNELDELDGIDNMPAKWQILINLGQQAILNLQDQNIS